MATKLLRGVAYITGAGSGIGQYTAYAFARHGVTRMALTDLRPENLKKTVDELKKIAPEVEVLPIEMNTADEKQVFDSVAQTVKQFGSLDIAVNNAGRGGPSKSTHELETKDWKSLIDVNLTGVWLCQKAQIQQMLKQECVLREALHTGQFILTSSRPKNLREGRGSIVNVASMLGTTASAPGTYATDYTATKHGVMGLTKADAIAYGTPEYRIRINAMCPGYVATPLLKDTMERGLSSTMVDEINKVPMGRMAEMEEIADSITWLSSPMASYACGLGLVVDGGYCA